MNFIKPSKHIHIYLTNIHNKTVRARGQFYNNNCNKTVRARDQFYNNNYSDKYECVC